MNSNFKIGFHIFKLRLASLFTSFYENRFHLLKQRIRFLNTTSDQSSYNEAVDGNNTRHNDRNDRLHNQLRSHDSHCRNSSSRFRSAICCTKCCTHTDHTRINTLHERNQAQQHDTQWPQLILGIHVIWHSMTWGLLLVIMGNAHFPSFVPQPFHSLQCKHLHTIYFHQNQNLRLPNGTKVKQVFTKIGYLF